MHIGVSIDARNVRLSQTSLYDLQAKLSEGGKRGDVPAMLQTLLADRFHLKIRRETRDLNVLALVEAKGGHKLKPSASDAPDAPPPPPQIRGGVTVGPGHADAHRTRRRLRITPGPNGNRLDLTNLPDCTTPSSISPAKGWRAGRGRTGR